MRTVKSWFINIKKAFLSEEGWKMIAKLFIVIGAVWGALLTLVTFHTERLEKAIERTENTYNNFVTQFGSPFLRIRIGAISNIPKIMLKRAPVTSKVGFFNALKYTIYKIPEKPVYQEEIKRLIYKYVKSMEINNTNWSTFEMTEIIQMFTNLGSREWYFGEPSDSKTEPTKALKWIWIENNKHEELFLPNIFENIRFDSVNPSVA